MLKGVRIRRMSDDGDSEETIVEYRLKGGKAEKTEGGDDFIEDTELSFVDNAVIDEVGKQTGVRIPPFADGVEKTYKPGDGAEFLAALLVRYNLGGRSWAETIE